jgi:hypothetical protein
MQKVGLGLGLGKRIWRKIIWLQIPPTFFISSSKRIWQKKIWLQIPPTIFISSLKKNPAEIIDPANFCHHLPQKESSGKLYGSRSRQLCSSAPSKESGGKLYGSRSRQLLSSAPSKRIRRKIIWLQIPPTLFMSSLKKNPVENYIAPDPANFSHQLPQKESGEKLYGSRSRQLSASANFVHELPQKESGGKLWLQIPPTFCISIR